MTHVNTNQHGLHRIHDVRELHLVQITASLAVDLSQDVGSLRHVEGTSVPASDDLRWDLVHLHDLLEHLIVLFAVKHADCHLWVSERGITTLHHVVHQLLLKLPGIVLPLKLNEVRLLDSNLEATTRVLERLVNLVSGLEVASTRL